MLQRTSIYFKSQSTRIGFLVGLINYIAYGTAHYAWTNPSLVLICAFVGFIVPFYSRWSNEIEAWVALKTAAVTPGRVVRFIPQWFFNFGILAAFQFGGVIPAAQISALGGLLVAPLLATAGSQGVQYIAIALSNREIGERNRNVIIALFASSAIIALGTLALPWTITLFYFFGWSFGILFFALGVLSDLRAVFPANGGIGVFFGTFNPLHKTHIEIIERAIRERNLDRVYIHSTVVPRIHREALLKGEIRIGQRQMGMRIYEKTDCADIQVNYFPTGNKFFEYETRVKFMELAIQEAGLSNKVTVLSYPDIYEKESFYGIINRIRQMHPGERLHGIHGSDLGGMWIRAIYDESGWIYPYAVKRRDGLSATAIRNGAKGMTAKIVEEILDHLKENRTEFIVCNQRYTISEGIIYES